MTMQGSEERYVQAMRIEDRKGRASHFSWKNRAWHRVYHQMLYDCSIRSADFGAVANREAWILAELKYGREPGRIWFVPNGVEERFFISREYREGDASRLLYVGTWLDRKGVYYLAEAFEQVADKFPEVTLTVAGCIAPEQEVKKYFRPGLGDRIQVIPFVQREEMPAVYMEHDIFVFPSLVEGMPLTLLEAMATGMPVVATNTCGMADVITSGVNGLLVPAADGSALAAAVAQLVASSELRRQLGAAGQESARGYTWSRVTRKLAEVFELAVESEKHSRGSGRTRGEEMR
jgi:glycosyltransferase involved in cell wall biosynthesis